MKYGNLNKSPLATTTTIDTRALSTEKIHPPHPLPHVSRKALKRVKHAIPPPESCRYCDGKVQLTSNAEVYQGREHGDWPYIYLCKPCNAYVGLHPNTDIPLGTMANKELRELRKVKKLIFIELSKDKGWSRNQAYHWLSERMSVKPIHCHWGLFGVDDCEVAGMICANELGAP